MRRLAVALLLVFAVSGVVVADTRYQVKVNGRIVALNPEPKNLDGRLYVPLRAVAEALGANVSYEADTRTAVIDLPTNATGSTEVTVLRRQLDSANETLRTMNQTLLDQATKIADLEVKATARFQAPLSKLPVRSVYLSIDLDGALTAIDGAVLGETLSGDLVARADGVHLSTTDYLVTVHGSDIAAWREKKITTEEFVRKWVMSPRGGVTAGGTAAVIESQIEGEFKGWTGETIFSLTNGQIWKQSSYAYTYHYAYRPKVLIYKSGSEYKLKVEGVDSEITVIRLK